MKPARKSSNSSYLSIRSKLIAAVAMLLVASFMVVSSSYAWFTLSTAPEIKGINTAVGANGNLEIALYTGQTEITSAIGDSNNPATWGNLIDLSAGGFGLDLITLLPARLNVNGDSVVAGSPLQTPVYSADGRVAQLKTGTLTGTYSQSAGQFLNEANAYGVRGIGNATAMSQQQVDYRSAQTGAALSLANAKNYATQALNESGSKLATIAAQHATNDAATDEGPYDLTAINIMLTKLEAAIAEMDKSVLYFIKADFASEKGSMETAAYNAAKAAYYAETVTTEQLASWVTAVGNTALTDAWEVRTFVNNAVSASRTKFNALDVEDTATGQVAGDGEVTNATWAETTATLDGLVDLSTITINGFKTNEVKPNMSAIVSDVTSGRGIYVTLEAPTSPSTTTGDGVYCEMAKLVGNFNVPILIEELAYGSLVVKDVKATMKTAVTNAPTINMVSAFPTAPSSSSSSSSIINDLYGYVIDLAFRTNAKDSHLMLQTTPENRIYSGNEGVDTMGGGSTMTFGTTTEFGKEEIANLMKAIRIVFTENNKIIGVGAPNGTEATQSGSNVTAPIKLFDDTSYDITNDGRIVPASANGALTFKTTDSDGASQLTALTQNETHKISVYVYLDGDHVTNADVAATSLRSMTGTMNLQFSSDANLVPMDYSPLKNTSVGGGSSGSADTTLSVTNMPTAATVGTGLTLPATDSNGTSLTWAVVEAGNTGATITNNVLTATAAGTVTVKGTATSGVTEVMTITVGTAG